jgi:nitrogen fixation-related uncharacterized protein
MYLVYSLTIFIISVLLMWWGLRVLRKRGQASCRGYLLGYLLIGLVPFLTAFLTTLFASLYYFKGVCYSITEGHVSCSFWEYFSGELYLAVYLFIPAIGLAIAAITLSFAAHWFFNRRGYFEDLQGGS